MDIKLASELNDKGLEKFSNGNAREAIKYLKESYYSCSSESGILVNLGLVYMQLGEIKKAEKCYQEATESNNIKTKRAAYKNLGFLNLWRGEWEKGWRNHGKRFIGENFLNHQWKGDPLNGKALLVWNDVGMGDIFQFIRYTWPLIQRGERIILATHKSQIDIIRNKLAWKINEVVDRDSVLPLENDILHIPLMNLVGLIDPNTKWGRNWNKKTWISENNRREKNRIGICWASNPGDKTMYKYKSMNIERILNKLCKEGEISMENIISLQTDETETHRRYDLKPLVKDWEETLRIINSCGKIHTVDTAVAHLAAGSGCEVNMHLNKIYDWRWKGEGPSWYSTIIINKK